MIIPIYKPLGASSHALAKRVGEVVGEKATHTGTLDPMAEGVLVVLTGTNRLQKGTLSLGPKEYSFSFCVGIATDTGDVLGIVTKTVSNMYSIPQVVNAITQFLPTCVGTQKQVQPLFSAQRVQGTSAFTLAASALPFTPKVNEITISSLEMVGSEIVPVNTFLDTAATARTTVIGNFRQEKIAKDWLALKTHLAKQNITELLLCHCSVVASKRTYVRALVETIGNALGLPTVTTAICRTKNGPFTLNDAKKQSKKLFTSTALV